MCARNFNQTWSSIILVDPNISFFLGIPSYEESAHCTLERIHQLHCWTCVPSSPPSLCLSIPSNKKERNWKVSASGTRGDVDKTARRLSVRSLSRKYWNAVRAVHQSVRVRLRARTQWTRERFVRTLRDPPLTSSRDHLHGMSVQSWDLLEDDLDPATTVRCRE